MVQTQPSQGSLCLYKSGLDGQSLKLALLPHNQGLQGMREKVFLQHAFDTRVCISLLAHTGKACLSFVSLGEALLRRYQLKSNTSMCPFPTRCPENRAGCKEEGQVTTTSPCPSCLFSSSSELMLASLGGSFADGSPLSTTHQAAKERSEVVSTCGKKGSQ